MKLLALAFLAMLLALPCAASAESLKCERGIAAEGDSALSVIYKCGEPRLVDRFCAPVYFAGTLQLVPEPYATGIVPCQPMEEWLYERGPGSLLAMVRVRSGIVQSIRYGRSPD